MIRALAFILALAISPALAQTETSGTPGQYGVIDANGNVDVSVIWDGKTPYDIDVYCQTGAGTCQWLPYAQWTSAQQSQWAARTPAAVTLTPASNCGSLAGASGCAKITGQDGNTYLTPVYPLPAVTGVTASPVQP